MSVPFIERLEERVAAAGSAVCIGLDPHPRLLDAPTAAAARGFCLRLIRACAPAAAAFKPNSAFFEALGPAGMEALAEVIAAVPEGIPVILDAKRGDIASTAEAYARAAFDVLGADAITLNPYPGGDAAAPFLVRPDRGAFILAKTSNPGADEVQALPVGSGPLYVDVARRAMRWSDHDNVGLVVGATDPAALAAVRAAVPTAWFLTPGIGAQGGDLEAALAAGLRADGTGMLVPASRSIATASDPGAAAADLRDAVSAGRPVPGLVGPTPGLAKALLEAGCVRFGEFALKSGERSPIYLDLRRLVSHPAALRVVAGELAALLGRLRFDHVAAIPYAALPIGVAAGLAGGFSVIYPRREEKSYGTRVPIEGDFSAGDVVVVLDDLVTTAASKFETIAKLEAAGLEVTDVVVLVDRSRDAGDVLAAAGHRLHAVTTLRDLVHAWAESGSIPAADAGTVLRFLEDEAGA